MFAYDQASEQSTSVTRKVSETCDHALRATKTQAKAPPKEKSRRKGGFPLAIVCDQALLPSKFRDAFNAMHVMCRVSGQVCDD